MIQEYYLHLFGGVNGEQDQSTGAGRLIIAALMSGYGLNASTKKDLQTRVGWRTTPGCFLGQKEISDTDYYVRNHAETKFALNLVPFRKVNRTMNYQLDWSVLNGDWDFRITSPIWLNIAKIYWLGYFLFGRNVLPDNAIATLRQRFNQECTDSSDQRRNLKCAYLMEFFRALNFPLNHVSVYHLLSDSSDPLPRHEVFGSLSIAMNWADNAPGFYTAAAMLPILARPGTVLADMTTTFNRIYAGRAGRFPGGNFPLITPYYYQYGMGRPSIPASPNRISSYGRDIVPLLFCQLNRTPLEEAETNYSQVMGSDFNAQFLSGNRIAWLTGAMLWEFHLFLTGRVLFPLERLIEARTAQNWSQEALIEGLVYLNPCNNKNSSVAQIARFNLERQLQV